MLRFRVSESLSIPLFEAVGRACADHIATCVRLAGREFATLERALDFGCGCGRVLRWLSERFQTVTFHGVDIDDEAIRWCSKNIRRIAVQTNAPLPPLRYPDDHFDLVYSVSVFTHLSEAMQDQWLEELSRVLKPGGLLIFTVHGDNAAKVLDDDSRRTLDQAGFVHRVTRKLSGIVPDWYNTSWHSATYIRHRLAASFEDVQYLRVPEGIQDFVVARLPHRGVL